MSDTAGLAQPSPVPAVKLSFMSRTCNLLPTSSAHHFLAGDGLEESRKTRCQSSTLIRPQSWEL